MKFLYLILLFSIISCSNKFELEKRFDCSTSKIKNTKQFTDFRKNYKIEIPKNWKTNLYYNSFQSEIFTADTTKQLTETYILDTSFNLGELKFDTSFIKKIDSVLIANDLELVSYGKEKFNKKPSYWYLSKGNKKGFTYHQLDFFTKLSKTNYFSTTTKVYGEHNINERFCESISIQKTVVFLE